MLQIFFNFIILNTFVVLISSAKIQLIIFSGSGGEVGFVIFFFFANFSNGGHLRYSTWPNFTILRLWSQVMLHVKFESCRSSGFINICFHVLTHDARRTH